MDNSENSLAGLKLFKSGGASVLASRRHFVWLRRVVAREYHRRAGQAVRPTRSFSVRAAFTLVELLVVITTMAMLAVLLLPVLAGTQVQSKTTACEARFRQWVASANLYASDNRGWLPTFDSYGGVAYARDVGTNLVNSLYPYGMEVPVWFCPMRPGELDAANQIAQSQFGHPIQSGTELTWYLSSGKSKGAYTKECWLNDDY